MDTHPMTLPVPDDVYVRARQIADQTARPIEQVLVEHLKVALARPLPTLPADEEAELEALHRLSDDALWTIAREQMPDSVQDRLQVLMDRNTQGTIESDEHDELQTLVERGDRLMVRKAQAAAILKQRGYAIQSQDLARRDE